MNKNKGCLISNSLARIKITTGISSLLIFLSGTTSGAEITPFSPAFLLKSGQILSTTDISLGNTSASASFSTGQGTSSKLRYFGVSETLLIGLPSNIELGAALSYSSVISKSPSSLQTTEGFIDPSYFINKTWLADSPAYRAKAGFSYTPHAGSHGSPNSPTRYTIGGSITKFMGDNSRVPQLIRQAIDFIDGGFKTLHYKRDICCVAAGFLTPRA